MVGLWSSCAVGLATWVRVPWCWCRGRVRVLVWCRGARHWRWRGGWGVMLLRWCRAVVAVVRGGCGLRLMAPVRAWWAVRARLRRRRRRARGTRRWMVWRVRRLLFLAARRGLWGRPMKAVLRRCRAPTPPQRLLTRPCLSRICGAMPESNRFGPGLRGGPRRICVVRSSGLDRSVGRVPWRCGLCRARTMWWRWRGAMPACRWMTWWPWSRRALMRLVVPMRSGFPGTWRTDLVCGERAWPFTLERSRTHWQISPGWGKVRIVGKAAVWNPSRSTFR